MSFLPEPPYTHGSAARVGILLVNLGTPQAPDAASVRTYLRQFLSDPRVVEIPRPLWWPILYGAILPLRPRASALKYAKIWTSEGSPLRVHTERQARLLGEALARRVPAAPPLVGWGMRYGNPSLEESLLALRSARCDRVLVLPLYPQYAASTTAGAYDAVFEVLAHVRNAPELRLVKHFHDHPGYIAALARSVREHWAAHGEPDRLLISFHGVPRFTLERGDPYHCECQKTGRLLAEALGLDAARYRISFQSRFGRARWLEPYTMDTVRALGGQGLRRVDVVCPGFVSDCLETLEEIGMENKAAFLSAGGREFHAIPCLNERSDWIEALADLAISHLAGWIDGAPDSAAAAQSRQRALALGAGN